MRRRLQLARDGASFRQTDFGTASASHFCGCIERIDFSGDRGLNDILGDVLGKPFTSEMSTLRTARDLALSDRHLVVPQRAEMASPML
jgi:hypothetical protein